MKLKKEKDQSERVLLIFDWLGQEDLCLYLIEGAPEWLSSVNGKYMGEDGNVTDLLIRISDAICSDPKCYDDPDDELAGAWVNCRVAGGELINLGSVCIVVAGWWPQVAPLD